MNHVFSRHETAKRLHAKRFSYTFLFSIVILVTILKSVSPMCQISLMQFTASSSLSGPGPQAIGSPLSTQMYILAQSLPHPAVLCLFRQAARQTTETQRMRKKDRTRVRLMGRFYPSSRPPNGLPPRSCVIYVKRALACFCPRQPSAFSRDPLSLPQPARHHMVEINKSSPERVRAASLKLKKDFFFFFQRGLNSSTGKKAALLP